MKRNSFVSAGVVALVLVLGAAGPESGQPSGLLHPVTKDNGPWMVMVISFQGPQATDLANKLVQELREKHKIPAYTISSKLFRRQDNAVAVQQTGFNSGRERQYESIAVLAGDFKKESDAAKLRDKIFKIQPKCFPNDSTSPLYARQGCLTSAFLISNPLAPKPAVATPKTDSTVLKINTGKNNLFNCPGDYTLQAVSFLGGVAYTAEQAKKLEQHSLLEEAGEHAEQVCQQLRKAGYDAYVFHGLTSSLVAVGSFSSPQDPQIEPLRKQLAGMKVGAFNLSPSPPVIQVPRK